MQGLQLEQFAEEETNEGMKGESGTTEQKEVKEETKEYEMEEEGTVVTELVLDEAYDVFYQEHDTSPHVKLMAFGQCLTFVVDTGSSFTYISRDFAETLSCDIQQKGEEKYVKGVLELMDIHF